MYVYTVVNNESHHGHNIGDTVVQGTRPESIEDTHFYCESTGEEWAMLPCDMVVDTQGTTGRMRDTLREWGMSRSDAMRTVEHLQTVAVSYAALVQSICTLVGTNTGAVK